MGTKSKGGNAPAVKPPEGWELQSPSGFMRCGPGPDDRLVRLHDVVSWLMLTRELPLRLAVEAVCNALEKHGMTGVYSPSEQAYAVSYDAPSPWAKFAGERDAQSFAQGLRAVWLMQPFELERLVNTPGNEPEYDPSKASPFEFSGSRGDPASSWAITWALAHEYWGWGDVAMPEAAQNTQPREERATYQEAQKPHILKRADLIKELEPEWSGIQSDLGQASKPGFEGLKAAKNGLKHGYWDVGIVRAWGKENHRIPGSPVAPLASVWPGKTTTHKAA